MRIMAGSVDGMARPTIADAPAVVSVLLNDKCNLACAHCYLENMLEPNRLDPKEWDQTFRSLFRDLKPGAVTFAGKEVFADRESSEVFFDALRTRDKLQGDSERRTDVGIVTNGTLVDRFRGELESSSLDWIDISIDGPREYNDNIRGKGSYAKAERNLGWLNERFGKHLWVLPTLCDANSKDMVFLVEDLNQKYKISGFSFGLYKDRSSAPNQHSMSCESVARVFDDLRNAPSLDKPARVVFDFTKDLHEYSSLFGMSEPNGETITEHEEYLGNNITLRIHRANVPVGLWRAVRISSEGDWLAAEDLLDHQRYKDNSVANLRDVDYNTVKAYEIGLQSERAQELGIFAEII